MAPAGYDFGSYSARKRFGGWGANNSAATSATAAKLITCQRGIASVSEVLTTIALKRLPAVLSQEATSRSGRRFNQTCTAAATKGAEIMAKSGMLRAASNAAWAHISNNSDSVNRACDPYQKIEIALNSSRHSKKIAAG